MVARASGVVRLSREPGSWRTCSSKGVPFDETGEDVWPVIVSSVRAKQGGKEMSEHNGRRHIRQKLLTSAAVLAGLWLGSGGVAYAQTADTGGGIETVTVTAEKRPENVQHVGLAI